MLKTLTTLRLAPCKSALWLLSTRHRTGLCALRADRVLILRRGHHNRHSRLVTEASSGFPSWKERNKGLGRSLHQLLNGDKSALLQIKEQATLLRKGELPPEEFVLSFWALCGSRREAAAVLAELAALLPTAEQQRGLLAAAQAVAERGRMPAAANLNHAGATEAMERSAGASGGFLAAGVAPVSSVAGRLPAEEDAGLGDIDMSESPRFGQDRAPRLRKKQRKAASAGSTAALPASAPNVLLWLRQDLRLHDNAALLGAAQQAKASGGTLTFVYIHSPEEDGDDSRTGSSWKPTGATLLWLHHTLAALDSDLQRRFGSGAAIVFKRGPCLQALQSVAEAAHAGSLHFSSRYEPAMQATDEAVEVALEAGGLRTVRHATYLLHEPADVRIDMSKWSGHFGTLTPFHRASERLAKPAKPAAAPTTLPVASSTPVQLCGGCSLNDLQLSRMPVRGDGAVVNWGAPIMAAWRCSEADAIAALREFLQVGFSSYEASKQFADARAVSRLSPYLHFGQLSARRVLEEARQRGGAAVSKTFMRRLVWRDLAYWQLHHWHDMPLNPIRRHYATQVWRSDAVMLAAWQRGNTGFPLVDAGMRQLWATGWMQQSIRMACASFLTEYLSIHWVEGARWFHRTLLDADLAINTMMWQNAGKGGLDQWNFTLLPTSRTQDPDGSYVRRWVPELAALQTKFLFCPWDAPAGVLAAAGVHLGNTYPERIITTPLKDLREENVRSIRAVRKAHKQGFSDPGGYDLITLPEGSTVAHDGKKMRVFTLPGYRDV